ncbi:MAG: class I SAM-dependent methyltransferase [Burkholderiales bacterium]|nr:class I SAM-dependent methyltransferase [Burkholderiales bacterium]
MRYVTLGHRLPKMISKPLFGDRKRFGLDVQHEDEDWVYWQERLYQNFYNSNQRNSIGTLINDSGYRVMRRVDIEGKNILEIGPGDIRHITHWKGLPSRYVIADISLEMLERGKQRLAERGVDSELALVSRNEKGELPFKDNEFDMIISFFSLEHLYPLDPYLTGMLRVLRPGGMLVGAIPNEGGLAWGCGRFFTSRRWFKKNSSIDPDKIICWEHPNFADFLLETLDARMNRCYQSFWPFGFPGIDINLVTRFIYAKR